jgi:hypothetical protein
MIEAIITKIIVFLIVFSCLFLFKEGFMFYKALVNGKKNITTKRLWGIGVAISFILTIIFTGIGL